MKRHDGNRGADLRAILAGLAVCAVVASPAGAMATAPDDAQPNAAKDVSAAKAAAANSAARTWTNSLGMTFVRIEPGTFTMGTTAAQVEQLLKVLPGSKREEFRGEQPAHQVRITRAFDLGKHEVTVGQFRAFVTAAHYQTDAERSVQGSAPLHVWFPQKDDHPVLSVSWNDARAFCDWLTKKEGGRVRYRLPTEAEWEYACRAGTSSLFSNGDDPEKLAQIGNVADASARKKYPDWAWSIKANDGYVYTAPVGTYPPNAWGLCDMIGNVWEWCEDGYAVDSYAKTTGDDPQGPSQAALRVFRGGCWFASPRRCRPADRGGFAPGFRCSALGFRVAAVRPE